MSSALRPISPGLKGTYLLSTPPGPRILVFDKPGFGDARANLVVIAGSEIGLNVQLFRIVRADGRSVAPKTIVDVPAIAPPVAREHDVHGTVTVDLVIAVTGGVKEAKILHGHPLLNQSALDAVQQWTFTATAIRGEPVEVAMAVTVDVE